MNGNRTKPLALVILCLLASHALAADGLVKRQSSHDVSTTADRLVSSLKGNGMTVFDRIDHAAGASGVNMSLRPTEVVIFGNPKVGTPLMQCAPTVAIDLPQKALIWRGPDDEVWLAYNDPAYLAERHGIEGCDAALEKIASALAGFADAATGD